MNSTSTPPLPTHPGNIFLAGEEVSVSASQPWQLFDYDGHLVKSGESRGDMAVLGKLAVGYYELRGDGQVLTTLGVLHPLAAPTPATSPIGVDVGMATQYQPPQFQAVANLCRLAGVNWVRDRLCWGGEAATLGYNKPNKRVDAMEPSRGHFAANTRYDAAAQIQSEAGLRVLQVNCITPHWAGENLRRYPSVLRDVYRFYRAMARRWKGQVQAFEPWNETDFPCFGGHTGAEIASMQKVSYLGLKAGNPEVIVCLQPLGTDSPAFLDELVANETWPYFDTCNLHYGIGARYASYRAISAGRPLWESECCSVEFTGADEANAPSAAALRSQAQRVTLIMATALHEGVRAAFYFLFGHMVEGHWDGDDKGVRLFGIVRRDLTPLPGYLALAAVGRLLADATPLGKLRADRTDIEAFLFSAWPDGKEQEVLVTWAASDFELNFPVRPSAAYDVLGRAIPLDHLKAGQSPVYVVLPPGANKLLALDPPPAMPAMKLGVPSPIVLQSVMPQQERVFLDASIYRLDPKPQVIPIHVYNFSEAPVKGALSIEGPAGWKLSMADRVELAPMERQVLELHVEPGADTAAVAVIIRGDFGRAGSPVLALRLLGGGAVPGGSRNMEAPGEKK